MLSSTDMIIMVRFYGCCEIVHTIFSHDSQYRSFICTIMITNVNNALDYRAVTAVVWLFLWGCNKPVLTLDRALMTDERTDATQASHTEQVTLLGLCAKVWVRGYSKRHEQVQGNSITRNPIPAQATTHGHCGLEFPDMTQQAAWLLCLLPTTFFFFWLINTKF